MKTKLHSSLFLLDSALPLLAILALGLTAARPARAQGGYLGPFWPPHRGVSFNESGTNASIGWAEGMTWSFSNAVIAASYPTVWGATNGGVKLSFDDDVYSAAEILTYQPSLSVLSNGLAVWSGQTATPPPVRTIYTRFVLAVTNQATGWPVALTNAASIGLATNMGGLIPVTSNLAFNTTLRFQATTNADGPFYPALTFFNDLVTNESATAYSSFGAGFYYSNNPPVLKANNTLTVDRGTSGVITSILLAATDNETPTNQLRFTVAPQGQGGPPHNGVLQLDGTNVAAGGSFSLGDIDLGGLTYLHDGNCETNDDFTFNVDDGDGGLTPTGEHTTYTFRINIAQPNLPPVALNASASTGLQAPYQGFLPATNADCTPQTLTFRIVDWPAKGDLETNDVPTGAFTYTPRPGGLGLDSFTFQVNDGYADSASPGVYVIVISNQPPVALSGSLSLRENRSVTNTLTATDPDQPPQALTFTIVTNGTKGSAVVTGPATGSFTFTPSANAIGNDSFAFAVSDGILSGTNIISVDIRPNLDEGDLLVADQSGKLVLIDNAGAQAALSSGGLLTEARGVAVEPAGQVLVISRPNGLIRVDPTSGAQSIVLSSTNFSSGPIGPWGLAVESAGTILVGDGTNGVVRVDPATGARTVLATGAPLAVPFGVALSSTGQVYVSDPALFMGQSSRVVTVNPQDGAKTLVSSNGNIRLPAGLAVEPSGNLLVADAPSLVGFPDPDYVLRIYPTNGQQTVLAGSNLLARPIGVGVRTNGAIFVVNMGNPSVVQIDPESGEQTLFASGGGLVQPGGIAVVPRDTAPPVLICPSNLVVTAQPGQCAAPVFFSVTAIDASDPAPVITCRPPSGAVLPVGYTNVLCTARDASGNSNTCSFAVSVYPAVMNPPTILGATNRVAEATGPAGAVLSFSVTATNTCQPGVPVTCTPSSGSLFPLGSTSVTCVAVDRFNLTNTATFTVTVRDTTPPSFVGPMSLVVTTAPGACLAIFNPSVTATDVVDGVCQVIYDPPSGTILPVGRTNVLCTATDTSGNSTNRTLVVSVYPTRLMPAGEAWTQRGSLNVWGSIASSADGTKLAATAWGTGDDNGRIYTSTDSGATWAARALPEGWRSVASSADGVKLVASCSDYAMAQNYLYTSANSGIDWTYRRTIPGPCYSVASSADGSKLIAGVNNEYIYTSTDSGVTWTARTAPGPQYWHSVASSADGTKLVAVVGGSGPSGYIYTSPDSGATWTARTAAGSRNWYSVASSADGTKLVAVHYGGQIYRSSDSGATWTAQTAAGSRYWSCVASSEDGTKLVAAVGGYTYSGLIYISTDSGATWTARESTRQWYSAASSADGSKLFAGVYSGYLYTSGDKIIALTNLPTIYGATNQVVPATSPAGAVATFSVTASNLCQANVPVTCTPASGGTFPLGVTTVTCVAVDGLNVTNTATFTVRVVDVPVVATLPVTNITVGGATLRGQVYPNGLNTVAWFEWGLTTSYDYRSANTPAGNGFGVFGPSSAIGGYPPETLCNYRAAASNSLGVVYGTNGSFLTLSTNCDLAGLGLVEGALDPLFNSNITSYAVSVPIEAGCLQVIPVKAHFGATIHARANGGAYVPLASGGVGPFVINVGANLVEVRVTAQDGVTTKVYALNVSRAAPYAMLVGPSFPPPEGMVWTIGRTNEDAGGRPDGQTWIFSNVWLSAHTPPTRVFWGATNNGVKISFDNSVYTNNEILTYRPDLSDLAHGMVVWSGHTTSPPPAKIVYTRFVLNATNLYTGVALPLVEAASLGLSNNIGGVVRVTDPWMAWKAVLRFQASTNAAGPFEAALDFFDDLLMKPPGSTAYSSFAAGFYHFNLPPTLMRNGPFAVYRGAGGTLTSAHLEGSDFETGPAQLRFNIAPQGQGAPPHAGTLWLDGTQLGAGDFFTQEDINLDRLTYVHDGLCSSNDNFTFNITDEHGGATPSGAHTTYTFPIEVVHTNLPPLALDGWGCTGLGTAYHGVLQATNGDCTPQTLAFRILSAPPGQLMLEDANTGAFTFTPADGQSNIVSFLFQVNDGFEDSPDPGMFSITISNMPPVAIAGSGSTRENIPFNGTLTGTDPDLPPQILTFLIGTNADGPTKGHIEMISNNTFTYTPTNGLIGPDAFTFYANDGFLSSSPASYTVNIRPNVEEGDVLIADNSAARIVLVDPAGAQGLVSSGGLLIAPHGLAAAPGGEIFAMDGVNGLLRVDPITGDQTLVCASTNFSMDGLTPYGIALESDGRIVVADGPNGVLRVDLTAGSVSTLAVGDQLNVPLSVALAPDGDVFVGDVAGALGGGASGIVRVERSSAIQTLLCTNVLAPVGLAVEASGDLLVADARLMVGGEFDIVLRLNPTNGTPTVLTASNLLAGAFGLAVGSDGTIYVINRMSSSVVAVNPVDGNQTLFATGGLLGEPVAIAVVPNPNLNRVLSIQAASDRVDVLYQGIAGRSYTLQRSANLSAWDAVTSGSGAANGQVAFEDLNPPAGGAFYRVRSP